ncbi:Uncharacterised protein [Neisseria meningitidis]|nr:Uncharacterised protein [Neisseria meningitidis]
MQGDEAADSTDSTDEAADSTDSTDESCRQYKK